MVIKDMRYIWSEMDSPLVDVSNANGGTGRDMLLDAKSTPSFALSELESLKHMEEGNRGGRVCDRWAAWKFCDNSLNRPWVGNNNLFWTLNFHSKQGLADAEVGLHTRVTVGGD